MISVRAPYLTTLAAAAIGFLMAIPADAASACKKDERRVTTGTPVYRGPGLGFDVTRVVEKDDCLRVVQTTDDGLFVLLELEKDRVGWVATGTVDERLSGNADSTTSKVGEYIAIDEMVLRDAPTFAAAAVGAPIPKDTPLSRREISGDGQWYKVSALDREGWVAKYQVKDAAAAAAPPTDGAVTGTDGWAEASADRRPQSERTTSTVPPEKASADTATPSTEGAPVVDGATPDTTETQTSPSEGANNVAPTDPVVDGAQGGAPILPVLGRTQELSVGFAYRAWQQSYTSDAQQDPFFKYELNVPVGGALTFDYGFRGEIPVVFDVQTVIGFTGYETPHIDNNVYTVIGSQISMWPRLGWRLHESPLVDVDAGVTAGADGFMNFGLSQPDVSTTLTGLYFGIGPSLVARSRLQGGEWGLLILEGSIPVGGYTMVPDPGARYTEYAAGADLAVSDPYLVRPDPTPETVPSDPNVVPVVVETPGGLPVALTEGAIPIHLMVGAQGRARYQYAFTDLLRMELGGSFTVRQALISGPGKRNGSYSEAANIDVVFLATAGIAFGL